MLLKRLLFCLLLTGSLFNCFAQTGVVNTQPRILLLLDRSSSMTLAWEGNRVKSKVADELILRLMDSVYRVNKDVEFSLRVFGHQSTVPENDCRDTRNEVPFAKDNKIQMEYRLDDIKPLGVTSIAYALQQAAEYDLVDINRNAYSIILITDGGESCGGDICAVMEKLAKSKVFFRPYIVNLESSAAVRASYNCMGDYLEVTRSGDLPVAVSKIVQAFRPVITVNNATYDKVKETAAKAPTVMNVTIPDVKVFDTVKPVVIASPTPKPVPAIIDRLRVTPPVAVKIYAASPVVPGMTRVSPYVPVVNEEAPAPEPRQVVTMTRIPAAAVAMVSIKAPVPTTGKTRNVLPYEPIIRDEPVERPAPQQIDRLAWAKVSAIPVNSRTLPQPGTRNVAPYQPIIIEELPQLPPPERIARLVPTAPKRAMTFILLENGSVIQYRRNIPPLPPVKLDIPQAPVVAKPIPTTKPVPGMPEAKVAEFTMETEDAKETSVEIYFTNGQGKFFPTTPQVVLLEAGTNKQLKRFYRTVDADGNPDPRTDIAPGTYNLAYGESRSVMSKNVVVEPNKKTKVYVTVKKASLSFEYIGANGRPVKEFEAVVIERNKVEGGAVVKQPCTDKLEYEPGNYHVEINTFPMDRRNVDLDFTEKVIGILPPGFAKFVGEQDMNSVTLYQRLGEKFMSFSTIKLADPVSQHLQIQPGEYQAHFHKGPGGSYASEKVVTFFIKSNEETEVLLK